MQGPRGDDISRCDAEMDDIFVGHVPAVDGLSRGALVDAGSR